MMIILYALLLAHFNAYKNQYANIGITFAISYALKRLLRSVSKDHADLVGLGGYSLTFGEFVKLLGQIKKNGIGTQSDEADKIIGGVLGKGIDFFIDLFQKKE